MARRVDQGQIRLGFHDPARDHYPSIGLCVRDAPPKGRADQTTRDLDSRAREHVWARFFRGTLADVFSHYIRHFGNGCSRLDDSAKLSDDSRQALF